MAKLELIKEEPVYQERSSEIKEKSFSVDVIPKKTFLTSIH